MVTQVMTESLTLEEQAQIQSELIRATLKLIEKADAEADLVYAAKFRNLVTMAQKELTNIQRALMYQGRGKKSKSVTELTKTE